MIVLLLLYCQITQARLLQDEDEITLRRQRRDSDLEDQYEDHYRTKRSMFYHVTGHELERRDLNNFLSKTRVLGKRSFPSAAKEGFEQMRKIVKRQQQQQYKPGESANLMQAPLTTQSFDYNYQQYPGFHAAPFYTPYNYFGFPQQYPLYSSPYYPPYDVTKRMILPFTPGYQPITSPPQQQQPYEYPYAFARAYNNNNMMTSAQEVAPTQSASISTASGISQGLIDLENDVSGFNQAIQYMKEAFISQNTDGTSNLKENIKGAKDSAATGDKKNVINKQKKSSQQLMDAYKRTLDSKNKLENKLVNYFTNYVCGDDC